MLKTILLATALSAVAFSASAEDLYDPTNYDIAAIRAAAQPGQPDEFRQWVVLQDILTDTSNSWDRVKRRWDHRTDPNDAELNAQYQAWWDELNRRVDVVLDEKNISDPFERQMVWLSVADAVDNEMPLAPINVIPPSQRNW